MVCLFLPCISHVLMAASWCLSPHMRTVSLLSEVPLVIIHMSYSNYLCYNTSDLQVQLEFILGNSG